jgi:hypothetical protein
VRLGAHVHRACLEEGAQTRLPVHLVEHFAVLGTEEVVVRGAHKPRGDGSVVREEPALVLAGAGVELARVAVALVELEAGHADVDEGSRVVLLIQLPRFVEREVGHQA